MQVDGKKRYHLVTERSHTEIPQENQKIVSTVRGAIKGHLHEPMFLGNDSLP
jgi:hypothetical protein